MTTSEFEKAALEIFADRGFRTETLLHLSIQFPDDKLLGLLAEVITNGLEPGPEHLAGVAEKHDRRDHITEGKVSVGPPFIGSHNLPHDTDWD